MNFDVSVNGKPWKVAIEPSGQPSRYTVTVKGKSREMDAAWIDADTLSLIDPQSGVAREIGLTRRQGAVEVVIAGRTFRAVVEEKRDAEKRGRESFPQTQSKKTPVPVSEGRQTVVSPMPGRVVRVLVAVGDKVTARQALVVVEAMKMENELRSPKDGVVRELTAREGTAVEAGAVLVVVE